MNILDTLTPERYVEELPFLLENLALEFPQLRLTIDPDNLALLASDLAAGQGDRKKAAEDHLLPCAKSLAERARAGESAQIHITREAVFRFAEDLARGTALRLEGPPHASKAPAR